MKGQWSKVTFSKERRLTGVLMQKGRVSLDSDFNERVDLKVGEGCVTLEIWERSVQGTEDPSIVEPAGGGPDTRTRGGRSRTRAEEIRVTNEVGRSGGTSSLMRVRLRRPKDPAPGVRFLLPRLEEVAVDGRPWRRVSSLSDAGPQDRVCVVENADGKTPSVVFGDGVNGASPPPDSGVTASYRSGGGGNLPPAGRRILRRR